MLNRHDRVSGTRGEGTAALRQHGRGPGAAPTHMGRARRPRETMGPCGVPYDPKNLFGEKLVLRDGPRRRVEILSTVNSVFHRRELGG